MRILLVGALALGVMASSAIGATLQPMQGRIELNSQSVKGPRTVKAGDIVTAGADGSATIVYADGCTLTVNPGTTVRVPAQSPCNLGAADFLVGGAVVAAGVGGAIILSQDDDDKPASP